MLMSVLACLFVEEKEALRAWLGLPLNSQTIDRALTFKGLCLKEQDCTIAESEAFI